MSVFSDDRAAIAAALTDLPADVAVHDHVPGRAIPPCVLVVTGDPLLERRDGDPYGSGTASYEVLPVVRPGANDKTTDDLETLVEQCLDLLTTAGIPVETVEKPFLEEVNGVQLLTTSIHVTTSVTFR